MLPVLIEWGAEIPSLPDVSRLLVWSMAPSMAQHGTRPPSFARNIPEFVGRSRVWSNITRKVISATTALHRSGKALGAERLSALVPPVATRVMVCHARQCEIPLLVKCNKKSRKELYRRITQLRSKLKDYHDVHDRLDPSDTGASEVKQDYHV